MTPSLFVSINCFGEKGDYKSHFVKKSSRNSFLSILAFFLSLILVSLSFHALFMPSFQGTNETEPQSKDSQGSERIQ